MPFESKITRSNVMDIIRMFAKAYRKALGKAPGEIIIVGGGSIMLNYQFRDGTQDLDVILHAALGIKDVITKFADDNHLPRDWMNTDFVKTASYSDALTEVSRHYCWLNNQTLEIRTVSGVYLIAMKLVAHRDYRNDISDAVGILIEEAENGNIFTYEDIESAYQKLYHRLPEQQIREQFQLLCSTPVSDLKNFYLSQRKLEIDVGASLVTYVEEGVKLTAENVENVAAIIRRKMKEEAQENP